MHRYGTEKNVEAFRLSSAIDLAEEAYEEFRNKPQFDDEDEAFDHLLQLNRDFQHGLSRDLGAVGPSADFVNAAWFLGKPWADGSYVLFEMDDPFEYEVIQMNDGEYEGVTNGRLFDGSLVSALKSLR